LSCGLHMCGENPMKERHLRRIYEKAEATH
jgi:hypothetical protein